MSDTQQPKVWGLTRASTLKQAESPATQREIIRDAAISLKLQEPTILDEPLGTSGRSKKFAYRPMGNFILRTLRKGETLIVTKVDRLGRNLRDIYDTVDTLSLRGVNVIILHGWGGRVIDMRNATDRMFLLLLAWFAEYEGERIAERTKEGLAHRRANGLSTGRKAFTFVQNYDAAGNEIPPGEYKKTTGCLKRNLADRQWLDQLCELLTLQKQLRVRGQFLVDYCRERGFVNAAGKEWWNGTLYHNARGTYTNAVAAALKKLRRMAVFGQLPEEYNERVLAITGDTPIDVVPKWQYRLPRGKAAQADASAEERESWTAEQWLAEFQELQATAQQGQ